MLHAKAFAKNPAGSCVCVVEKFMLPHCILQECFVFVLRMLLKKQFVMRALRRVRQSVWRRRACVRRDSPVTDLPFLLAGAAEQGAIAPRVR